MSDELIRVTTCVFWDLDDFPVPYNLNPNILYHNLESALEGKGFPGTLKVYFYCGKPTLPDDFVRRFLHNGFFTFYFEGSGDIYERTTMMLRDVLLWSVDYRMCGHIKPLNLVLVSDKFTSGETKELLSFLQALKPTKFKILLALSEEPESGALCPTVNFEYLWRGILIDLGLCTGCGYKAHAAKQEGQKRGRK